MVYDATQGSFIGPYACTLYRIIYLCTYGFMFLQEHREWGGWEELEEQEWEESEEQELEGQEATLLPKQLNMVNL